MKTTAALNGVTGETADELAQLFHVLSDKTRLNILFQLAQGERNVTTLCDQLGMPQPTVSHHLGLLRMNGLVASRRAGKQQFYSLDGRSLPAAEAMLAFDVEGMKVSIGGQQAFGD